MSEITPNTPNPVREDAYVEELSEKLGIDPQYIPKSPVWRNEEEIKAIAEMFANMSGGSGGGVLVVHDVNGTLDKTWNEIKTAALNQGVVVQSSENHISTYVEISQSGADTFAVYAIDEYYTDSADGYPAKQ